MKLDSQNFYKTEDGAYLYYRDEGEGVPLLLMHGWSLSGAVYEKTRRDLAGSYRVITPDFRGHGYSSKVLTGHTVEQYARDMKQLLDFLGVEQFVLCGWSMSVIVALKYTELFGSGALLGIVLMDGPNCPFADEPWSQHKLSGYNMDGLVGKMNRLTDEPEQESLRNAEIWFKEKEKFKGAVTLFAGELRKTPIWISYAVYNDYMMQDMTDVIKKLTVPALIMVPENHRERGVFQRDAVTGAELEIFDAGHAFFYEKPELFRQRMEAFLERCLKTNG